MNDSYRSVETEKTAMTYYYFRIDAHYGTPLRYLAM